MAEPILEVRGLSKTFGPLVAVDDVDISIPRQSLVSIIGPNGAGKTTFFNLLSGKFEPSSGKILFDGERIDGVAEHKIARRGVARSFQISNFYPELTVRENIRLGVQAQTGSVLDSIRHHERLGGVAEETDAILGRIGLTDVATKPAQDLSHGQQRHLEVGIGLGVDPELLLLDEPTAGMSSEETARITGLIDELAEELTLIMIEHDMEIVMDVSDEIIVMDRGTLLARGPPREVSEDERVQDVYLGRA